MCRGYSDCRSRKRKAEGTRAAVPCLVRPTLRSPEWRPSRIEIRGTGNSSPFSPFPVTILPDITSVTQDSLNFSPGESVSAHESRKEGKDDVRRSSTTRYNLVARTKL